MRHALLSLALAALLAAGCEPGGSASPAESPRVFAAGNQNNLYAGVTAQVDGEPGFRFYQRDALGTWHAGEPALGAPAAVAAWREHLMVFFPTGRCGRFGLGRPDVEPAPLSAWKPAAACEDGLAAVVFGFLSAGDAVVLRYENGTWSEPEMPTGLERDRMLAPQIVRFGDRLFIVWREEVQDFPGAGAPYRLRFLTGRDGGKWQGPLLSRLRVGSAAHVAAAGDTMICLFRKVDPSGGSEPWFLATYATADEDWHETGRVEGPVPEGEVALARAGDDFFVATLDGGRPIVARLDVGTRQVEPAEAVAPERTDAEPADDLFSIILVVTAGVAFMLLMVGLRRARGMVREPLPVGEPGEGRVLVPASLARRGAAVAIDYLLLGVVFVLPLFALLFPDAMGRLLDGERLGYEHLLRFEAVRQAVLLVYFALTEGLFGRTIGKTLLGIEVRSETGRQATFRQVLVRTALRPIDELPGLYLFGLMHIIVSPKPQRLGDRLGRTLVVDTRRSRALDRSA